MSDLLKQLRHEAGIFRRGGANGRADLIGNAADLIEQLQQQTAKAERKAKKHMQIDMGNREVIDMQKQALSDAQSEIEALAAHVARYEEAFEKGKLFGEAPDDGEENQMFWQIPDKYIPEQPHTTSLAERDAEVAMAAIRTALRNFGAPNLTESSIQIFANEYAERIKNEIYTNGDQGDGR